MNCSSSKCINTGSLISLIITNAPHSYRMLRKLYTGGGKEAHWRSLCFPVNFFIKLKLLYKTVKEFKTTTKNMCCKDVEKLKLFCIGGGNKMVQLLWKTVWRFLKNQNRTTI